MRNEDYVKFPSDYSNEEKCEWVYKYMIDSNQEFKDALLLMAARMVKFNWQEAEDLYQEASIKYIRRFEIRTDNVGLLKASTYNWYREAMSRQNMNNNRSRGNQDSQLDPKESDWLKLYLTPDESLELKEKMQELLFIAGNLHKKISVGQSGWKEEITWYLLNKKSFAKKVRKEIEENYPHLKM